MFFYILTNIEEKILNQVAGTLSVENCDSLLSERGKKSLCYVKNVHEATDG